MQPTISLIWEDQFDLAGRADQARAIAVNGNRAVAIGVGSTVNGGVNLLVRAYDIATGTLAWQDQAPLSSGYITNVVIDETADKVFCAGYAPDLAHGGSGADFLVRAYDATTGNRLWEDIANKGRDDFVQGIAAGPHGVYVVGYGGNIGPAPLDFLVRAYDGTTGSLLWEDQVDKGSDDAAWRVATHGQMVCVAGSTKPSPDDPWDLIVRAYDAVSGTLIWESAHPKALPSSVAVTSSKVYVGGLGFIAAYDSQTGALLWSQPIENVIDLAATESRIFAAGHRLRAYDNEASVVWETQLIGDESLAHSINLNEDTVFLAGRKARPHPNESSEFLVQAYDAGSGKLLWEDRSHLSLDSTAFDLATAGDKVVVVGWNTNLAGNTDFLIRAYEATPGPPQQKRQGREKTGEKRRRRLQSR